MKIVNFISHLVYISLVFPNFSSFLHHLFFFVGHSFYLWRLHSALQFHWIFLAIIIVYYILLLSEFIIAVVVVVALCFRKDHLFYNQSNRFKLFRITHYNLHFQLKLLLTKQVRCDTFIMWFICAILLFLLVGWTFRKRKRKMYAKKI